MWGFPGLLSSSHPVPHDWNLFRHGILQVAMADTGLLVSRMALLTCWDILSRINTWIYGKLESQEIGYKVGLGCQNPMLAWHRWTISCRTAWPCNWKGSRLCSCAWSSNRSWHLGVNWLGWAKLNISLTSYMNSALWHLISLSILQSSMICWPICMAVMKSWRLTPYNFS